MNPAFEKIRTEIFDTLTCVDPTNLMLDFFG